MSVKQETYDFAVRAAEDALIRAEAAERRLDLMVDLLRSVVEDCTCDFRDCDIHHAAREALARGA